jgi:hypothetical protein
MTRDEETAALRERLLLAASSPAANQAIDPKDIERVFEIIYSMKRQHRADLLAANQIDPEELARREATREKFYLGADGRRDFAIWECEDPPSVAWPGVTHWVSCARCGPERRFHVGAAVDHKTGAARIVMLECKNCGNRFEG